MRKQMLRLQEENEILKKAGHIREKVSLTELSDVIDKNKDQYPIQRLCDVLDVPRSTYYQASQKKESNRERENRELIQLIKKIHEESKQRYGAPKIHNILGKNIPFISVCLGGK
jgi:putative transposase